MVHLHIAFSLGLLALVAGTFLFIWSKNRAEGCSWLGKIIGFIVMILALIMTICSIVCAVNLMMHHDYGRMGMPAALTSAMSTSSVSSEGAPTSSPVHRK